MNLSFQAMKQEQAEDIANNWQYDGEYAFYNMDADLEDLQEFLDPEQRKDAYYAVTEVGEVIGFYNFTQTAENTIDIGLGMKPDLTGNGNGFEFLEAGLGFAESVYDAKIITLSVAAFNVRAIKVYKQAGFKEVERFEQATNGAIFEFVKMIYHSNTAN